MMAGADFGRETMSSGLARFDSYPLLPTAGNSGDRALLKNPFSPTGWTEVYFRGVDPLFPWAPVDGQVLYNSLSRTQLDSVTGLAAGVVAEIWSSPVLPDWFIADGSRAKLCVRASVQDASVTASTGMAAIISAVPNVSSDMSQSVCGFSYGIGAFEYGIADGVEGVTWRDGSTMRSRGGSQSTPPSLVTRAVGTYAISAMKIRLRVVPSATSNVFKPYGAIWIAGGFEA